MNRSRLILGLLCCLAWSNTAWCCNVPVFRFALERWKPDNYQVLLLHRGPLTAKHQELLASWESREELQPSNSQRRLIDLAQAAEPDVEKFSSLLAENAPPHLALLYPAALKIDEPCWTAPLNEKTLQQLHDSPRRRELISRLIQGQTAVWLLVESGNGEQDKAAEALLTRELKRLENELKLPELTDAPEDQLLGGPPLAIRFSILVIPRTDDEEVLRQMLVNCEADIPARTEPLVYPVFGRGRSLLPMIGAGITADNIQEYAEFLVGACSCEIKEQNPGFDLLLAANWDALLKEQGYKPTAISSKDPLPAEPEIVAIPAGSANIISDAKTQAANQASPDDMPAKPKVYPPKADPSSYLKWYAGLGLAAIVGLGFVVRIMSRSAAAH